LADGRRIEAWFIQLSKIRGAANGNVETSRGALEVGARVYGALRECRRKRQIRVKRESLNLLYRKEKRAFGVGSVFSLRYRLSLGFGERYDAEKPASFPMSLPNKVTGEMRVKAKSRPVWAETYKRNWIAPRIAEMAHPAGWTKK